MKKLTGILSIGLIGVGVVIGCVLLMIESTSIGLMYLGVGLLSIYIILMNYCRKCPHSMNGTCHHGLPGRIAKKLPYKKTGKYTLIELALVILAIGVTFAMPLFIIYSNVVALVIYVAFWVCGGLLLRVKVCPNCYNRWCIVCPNRVK